MTTRDSVQVLLLAAGFFHSMCVISNYIKTDKEKAEERERKKEDIAKKLGKGQAVSKMPAWLKKKAINPHGLPAPRTRAEIPPPPSP